MTGDSVVFILEKYKVIYFYNDGIKNLLFLASEINLTCIPNNAIFWL
jgi:hypothetical protein